MHVHIAVLDTQPHLYVEALTAARFTVHSERLRGKHSRRVLRAWRRRGWLFVRHLNGRAQDNTVDNVAWVNVADLLAHLNEWTVDWAIGLTKAERRAVRRPGFAVEAAQCVERW